MQEWAIREARGNDLAFIYSTWLNSYRSDSHHRKTCTKFVFFKEYPKVIDLILARSQVLVACLPDDENVIIGYLVCETMNNILHYAYTKESFRNLGVAKSLIKWTPLKDPVLTHKTRCVEPLIEFLGMTYNPFLLFERGEYGEDKEDSIVRAGE